MSVTAECPKINRKVSVLTCEECVYFDGVDEDTEVICAFKYKTVPSGWEDGEEPEEN
jgi:hypothetical protein